MLHKQEIKMFLVILTCAVVTAGASATLIDFEGTGAPNFFADTVALRDLYAELGVHFDGPGPLDGGAILNQGGVFGVFAHSGSDFLAFNITATGALMDGGTPKDPEEILFDNLQATVSIYAAGGFGEGAMFRMDAFDSLNQLVDTDTVEGQTWHKLLVEHQAGIARVVLTEISDNKNSFVYDDLAFFAVPGPGVLLVFGLAGMRTTRRRD